MRPERIVVLGMSPLGAQLLRELERSRPPGCEVVGVIDDPQSEAARGTGRGEGGSTDALDVAVRCTGARRIVAAGADRRGRLPLHRLMAYWLQGITIEPIEDFYERKTGRVAIEALTPSRLILTGEFFKPTAERALARAVSVALAAIGLVLALPLLALIAFLVKLDSRGPILFLQDRIGLNGRSFRLVKFRTMHPGRDSVSEWARDNRHRITRVGRVLRKYRLDELPQLVNILRGDMNLVGPRPHPVSNLALLVTVFRNTPECGSEIPYYTLRVLVRPGVTGWAQVRYGYANDVQEEIEKLRYDLYYVKHCSFWLDLRILLETVRVVLVGERPGRPESAGRTAQGGGWRAA